MSALPKGRKGNYDRIAPGVAGNGVNAEGEYCIIIKTNI